ncbi:predicted protein [Naegleria gruberi]|uniref:Predicted protein n=1 Tax=Naegleria gruberi TaxID=5762 RepID=D2VVI8_NAEGR|nr:uncharacterized protein NAEGRDRAFT_52597 [Naegleria gruberi]EFC39121.1 predicted protein [Naegleria gruberi]|eukprot:XP_002671865.1 predicted protein [Naegleria gruberi strain NEG-M]
MNLLPTKVASIRMIEQNLPPLRFKSNLLLKTTKKIQTLHFASTHHYFQMTSSPSSSSPTTDSILQQVLDKFFSLLPNNNEGGGSGGGIFSSASSWLNTSLSSISSSTATTGYSIGSIASILALLLGSAYLVTKYYMPILDFLRFSKSNADQQVIEKIKEGSFKEKTNLNNMDMSLFWYPVALSTDIKINDKKPFVVKLLGEPLVLYRTSDGQVTCTLDLCPHRSAKLSTGEITEFEGKRSLECAYHGWRFEKDGQCVRIPSVSSERMKGLCKTIKCQSKQVHECCGMIWVWPNDKVKSDINQIPIELFREEYLTEDSTKPYIMLEKSRDIPCNYSLVLENLLDFAHLDFTHDGTLGKRSRATQVKTQLILSKDTPAQDDSVRSKLPTEMHFDKTIHSDSFTYRVTKPEYQKVKGVKREFGNITSFIPPCFVRLDNTDYIEGGDLKNAGPRISQIFCMIPTGQNEHRIIFRFYSTIPVLNYLNKIPYIYSKLLQSADTILDQDLELLFGISENVTKNGAKVFSKIVNADAPIKAYRDWEAKMLKQNKNGIYFKGWETPDIEDLL